MKIQRFKIDFVRLEKLRPIKKLENVDEIEMLLKEIEIYGLKYPIVVDKNLRFIIDGNKRYYVFKQLGLKKIPVVYIDYTDVNIEVKRYFTKVERNDDLDEFIKLSYPYLSYGYFKTILKTIHRETILHFNDLLIPYELINEFRKYVKHQLIPEIFYKEYIHFPIIIPPEVSKYQIINFVYQGKLLPLNSITHIVKYVIPEINYLPKF